MLREFLSKVNAGDVGMYGVAVTCNTASSPGKTMLPARELRVMDAFPNESVVFPFSGLPRGARQSLSV